MERAATTVTNWRRWLVRAALSLAGVAVVLYVGVSLAVASGVRAAEEAAMRDFSGDRIVALVAYVDSASHTLAERNRAVWALGQLGDRRALPVLEKYVTGGKCRHDRELCQHELAKAVRLCRGGRNLTALLWRRGSV
jgi:PBS lyase HEAT-like repeat-containing protein